MNPDDRLPLSRREKLWGCILALRLLVAAASFAILETRGTVNRPTDEGRRTFPDVRDLAMRLREAAQRGPSVRPECELPLRSETSHSGGSRSRCRDAGGSL